ncbi:MULTISPECIES: P-loop NTPase fold protein [Burkholderia]|nr:P-loop NTPase fold protein [Burkholderia ambifaria]
MKQTTQGKAEEQKEQWPQLIRDTPSSVDDIGSFNDLVKAIHRMLVHTTGGMTVSINGSWGTGKSTFIRLLEKALTEEAKPDTHERAGWRRCIALPKRLLVRGAAWVGLGRHGDGPIDAHVFLYDAWAHSGDPLRRAFLSDLLTSLSDRPRYDQSIWLHGSFRTWLRSLCRRLGDAGQQTTARGTNWNTFAERLAGRRRVSRRQAKVKVGWLGRLVVTAGVAWAIKDPLWHRVIKPLLPELTKRLAPVQSFAAGKLALLPPFMTPDMARLALLAAVVGIGVWILFFNGLASVLANKGVVSETVDATEDPVPTSIEFANYFHRIIEAALAGDTRRRLIIVLDNLDRLSEEERNAAWGFLKSFVENKQVVGSDWYERMWVLVPWSDAAIEAPADKATAGGTPTENAPAEGTIETEKTVASGGANMEVGLAEKLFQLRIDIPPPTLIAWQQSLRKRLREAFGRLLENEAEDCIVEFFGRRYRSDAEISIRRMVCFVNELVVLYYRHPSIPLDVLAAFVVSGGRDGVISVSEKSDELAEHQNLIDQLGSGSKKHVTANESSKLSLMTYFAQLRYGSSNPDLAMNHLLVPQWQRILESGSLGEALQLLRNASGISALKMFALEFTRWMGSATSSDAFRVLAILRAKAMRRGAPDSLLPLSRSENWNVIATNIVKVMRTSTPKPSNDRSLVKWFRAYFVITEARRAPNPEARKEAVDALGRYEPVEEVHVQELAELLLLPQFMEEMAINRGPELSLNGGNYILLWEKLGKVAIDDRCGSIEALYQKGLGLWRLKPDVMTQALSNMYRWPNQQSFFDILPIISRSGGPSFLSEALDTLLYVMAATDSLREEYLPKRAEREKALQIHLAELGRRQSLALLQGSRIRERIFRTFTEDKRDHYLRDVHLNGFLLLLAGTIDWESALEHTVTQGFEPGNPRAGEQYFQRILTLAEVAKPYVKALQDGEVQLAKIVDSALFAADFNNNETMTLAYWRRVGEHLRTAMSTAFHPRPTDPSSNRPESALSVHAVGSVSEQAC